MLTELFPKILADQVNPKNDTQSNIAYAAKLYGMNQIGDEILKVAFKSKAIKVQEKLAELELRRRALELGMSPKDVMNGNALREKGSELPTLATLMAAGKSAPIAVKSTDSFMRSMYQKDFIPEIPKFTTTFTFAKNPAKLGFLGQMLKVR